MNTLQKVIEIVIFSAVEGVTNNQMKLAAQSINPEIKKMKGFISREIVQDHKGKWVDICHWESMDAANSASEALMQNPVAGAYFSLINQSTMVMMHLSE